LHCSPRISVKEDLALGHIWEAARKEVVSEVGLCLLTVGAPRRSLI
jgi:hypothetical protein